MDFPDRCILWPQTEKRDGYAIVRVGGFRLKGHRFFYELFIGPIPPGLHVLHSCDTCACVNPLHLRTGTHAENMAEMSRKGRAAWGARSGCTKLTEKQVREIRASKEKLREMAPKFGVGISILSQIRRGEAWKHLK